MKKTTQLPTKKYWMRLFDLFNKVYDNKLVLQHLCISDGCIYEDDKDNKAGSFFYYNKKFYIVIRFNCNHTFLHELSHLIHYQIYKKTEIEDSHSKNFEQVYNEVWGIWFSLLEQRFLK